ncbi:carboxylesterase family protein [Nonomuraea wenchangensis]
MPEASSSWTSAADLTARDGDAAAPTQHPPCARRRAMTATAPTAPAPGVRSWWGIPYATAERYRRPVVADFDPHRPYDRKGVAPVQPDSGDWLEADSGMGEDSLNLNVWAPEQPADKALPVTVYIHGGGFEYGAHTQITSNAAGLAATGRVVGVSINYRLGALGAVSLSQYGGRLAEASNLCLQDVIAALTWIKQNIAHFGGDPDKVTVYGHSAGGFSAFGLLGAPSADGLYRRLAGFSGGPSRIQPAWWAEELAHRFVTELGVADNPDKLLARRCSRSSTAASCARKSSACRSAAVSAWATRSHSDVTIASPRRSSRTRLPHSRHAAQQVHAKHWQSLRGVKIFQATHRQRWNSRKAGVDPGRERVRVPARSAASDRTSHRSCGSHVDDVGL